MASSDKPNSRSVEQLEAELADVRRELKHREQTWQSQLDIAARVHESLLPKPVRLPRIEVEVRYAPMEAVGGDYCQVLFPVDSECYVTLCDVTGHGIGPALLATRVSSYVRQLVMQQLRPVQIVENLNSFVVEHFSDTGLQFLSFFATQIDLENGTVIYSGAGHPGPLLIRRDDDNIEVLASQNMLIGAEDRCLSKHPEDVRAVAPGDRLLFFTDGLTESMDADGAMLGSDGLQRILDETTAATVSELADRIEQRVTQFRHGPPHDDMTLIVAELVEFGDCVPPG